MNQKTAPELEVIVTDAKDYLLKYFEVNLCYDLGIFKMNLPNHFLGRIRTDKDNRTNKDIYSIDIDDGKLMRKLRKANLEYRLPFVLDVVIGEQIGHMLFYLSHKEMHVPVLPEDLMPVSETIGCYAGIVYANRNNLRPLFLTSETENKKTYDLANQLYLKYRDTKLAELSRVKSKNEFQLLIRSYDIQENDRTN